MDCWSRPLSKMLWWNLQVSLTKIWSVCELLVTLGDHLRKFAMFASLPVLRWGLPVFGNASAGDLIHKNAPLRSSRPTTCLFGISSYLIMLLQDLVHNKSQGVSLRSFCLLRVWYQLNKLFIKDKEKHRTASERTNLAVSVRNRPQSSVLVPVCLWRGVMCIVSEGATWY